jgi:hypothetical protein
MYFCRHDATAQLLGGFSNGCLEIIAVNPGRFSRTG